MDGVSRRRETGLGTGAENWVKLAIQVDLGAPWASPDPAVAMAKKSAESKVGECPVVDATVDVEREDTKEP